MRSRAQRADDRDSRLAAWSGGRTVDDEIHSNRPESARPARIMPAMVDVSVSGIVRATPEDVFRFLADLENWPRWQSDMKSASLASGPRGEVGAVYRYVSKAMGMTFDSTVRLTRVDTPREIAFEGEWTGMIRPDGRYLVEPAPEGSRVTLNPHPQVRGIGRLMEPVIAFMGRRLNKEHLEALRRQLEKA
jgi:carbon monoxide dehydrogenase subunit G